MLAKLGCVNSTSAHCYAWNTESSAAMNSLHILVHCTRQAGWDQHL